MRFTFDGKGNATITGVSFADLQDLSLAMDLLVDEGQFVHKDYNRLQVELDAAFQEARYLSGAQQEEKK